MFARSSAGHGSKLALLQVYRRIVGKEFCRAWQQLGFYFRCTGQCRQRRRCRQHRQRHHRQRRDPQRRSKGPKGVQKTLIGPKRHPGSAQSRSKGAQGALKGRSKDASRALKGPKGRPKGAQRALKGSKKHPNGSPIAPWSAKGACVKILVFLKEKLCFSEFGGLWRALGARQGGSSSTPGLHLASQLRLESTRKAQSAPSRPGRAVQRAYIAPKQLYKALNPGALAVY